MIQFVKIKNKRNAIQIWKKHIDNRKLKILFIPETIQEWINSLEFLEFRYHKKEEMVYIQCQSFCMYINVGEVAGNRMLTIKVPNDNFRYSVNYYLTLHYDVSRKERLRIAEWFEGFAADIKAYVEK